MTTLMHNHPPREATLRIISTLGGSPTHQLGVTVYRAHYDTGNGSCARCSCQHPCPCRLRAADLIAAAGDNPRRYDGPKGSDSTPSGPSTVTPGQADNTVTAVLPVQTPGRTPPPEYEGYPVGGHGRPPMTAEGFLFSRESE
jgi:hypothetical protein